uniref:Nebulette n=1 Tax=Poecilia reticulata TaxID=8081 RepID=A0A3P9P179_POERE
MCYCLFKLVAHIQNLLDLYVLLSGFHLQLKYKEEGRKDASVSLYAVLPETMETQHAKEATSLQSQVRLSCVCFSLQRKYRDSVKKDLSCSLFHQLPETLETLHAKEASDLLSEVSKSYKEKFNREKGRSDYSSMKNLPEVEHAMEVARKQSHVNVSYRSGREELQRYNPAPDRPDIISAANAAKLASDVTAYTGPASPAGGAHLSVLQVKYKESFDRLLKGQRPRYNPMDCVSFKHTQAAAALASQLEYKKKYEQTKAHYHIAVDTAEQQHHRENAVLHSQVKYREEYEKNKGRSLMEFGETQSYKVSKEAQKMQSEREYRRDFEEQVKGKALLEADQTPGFLAARNASSLLSEKAYRKDLEQEVKGRGLSGVGLEETPELLRVKKASQILNQSECRVLSLQKEYRRDLETEILGKGMELSADVLEIQRATRASQVQSQVPDRQALTGSRLISRIIEV